MHNSEGNCYFCRVSESYLLKGSSRNLCQADEIANLESGKFASKPPGKGYMDTDGRFAFWFSKE